MTTSVTDHLGNTITVGTRVRSGDGKGPHRGVVERIDNRCVKIRAVSRVTQFYVPETWFFSRPACGWVAV